MYQNANHENFKSKQTAVYCVDGRGGGENNK